MLQHSIKKKSYRLDTLGNIQQVTKKGLHFLLDISTHMNPIMTFINNFFQFLGGIDIVRATVSNIMPRHTTFVSGSVSFSSLIVRHMSYSNLKKKSSGS